MKELLKYKGDLAKEIENLEEFIKENKDTKNYTGLVVMKNKLESKKDMKKLIDIIWPML